MQKKLIAAAVAALASTGAMAQVTMYGIADAFLFSAKAEGVNGSATKVGVGSGLLSGPRLGFKGEEDLGDGMKAVALYEVAVNLDDGSYPAAYSATQTGAFGRTRQAYVGLQGAMGRLSLGQQYTHGYFAPGNNDGFAAAIISPQTVLAVMAGSNVVPTSATRVSNSVNYVSNAMGPLTLNALYGFGETNKDSAAGTKGKSGNTLALGANVKLGALNVDGVYVQKNTTDDLKQTDLFLGAAYNLGVATVGFSYQTVDKDQAAPADDIEDKVVQVNAIVPVGKGNIHVGYGQLDRSKVTDDKAKSIALAYTHALGKRTTLFAGYNRTSTGNSSPFAGASAGVVVPVAVANGKASTIVATGLRLTF